MEMGSHKNRRKHPPVFVRSYKYRGVCVSVVRCVCVCVEGEGGSTKWDAKERHSHPVQTLKCKSCASKLFVSSKRSFVY